jgi:hypothetical protein
MSSALLRITVAALTLFAFAHAASADWISGWP